MGVRHALAAANLLAVLAIGTAVLGARPLRSPWVDIPAAAVGGLLIVSAVGLAVRARWAFAATRAAAMLLLVVGLAAAASAMLGLLFYRAVASPSGGPGSWMFIQVFVLALPYAVAYPAGVLLWLAGPERRS